MTRKIGVQTYAGLFMSALTGARRFYFLFLSFAFHASFAPEHDLSVQAALQIPLFWSHIDTYLWLTACKSCLVHCKGTCH